MILLHCTLQQLSCYTLGATVRTVRGEKCRKLPTCLEPKKDESRGVGSSLINLRSGAEPDVNCQLPKRKVLSPLKISKNQSDFMKTLFLPKYQQNFFEGFLPWPLKWGQIKKLIGAFYFDSLTLLFWFDLFLKVTFFQKVWFIFQISGSPKKNIPKTYPELEV